MEAFFCEQLSGLVLLICDVRFLGKLVVFERELVCVKCKKACLDLDELYMLVFELILCQFQNLPMSIVHVFD